MRMAIVSQNASPGILVFRKDLIQSLANAGHTVYAFAVDYTPASRQQVEALGAIPVDYSLSRTGMNPFRDLSDTWRLARQFKELSIDLVFSFFVKPSIYATLAARLAGVPRRYAMLEGLGFIHTPTKNGFTLKKRVLQLVQGALVSVSYAFAHKVLFLNPDDPKDLCKTALLNQRKLHVLGPIGLNLDDYAYVPVDLKKPVSFIFIARLLSEKGIFEYIDAAKKVKASFPEASFLVLGGLDEGNPSGISASALNAAIEEGIIQHPGHVDNVADYIADSHVFVLPSYYREGVPRSTQEAMAMGRAIITTDVPGCRETVEDGVNGFLVPPWHADMLAEKMRHFVDTPHDIEKMGMASFNMAQEKFDARKINETLLRLLDIQYPARDGI